MKEEVNQTTGERILTDADGNRIIASSKRPDGSLRKEIKIRKGFVREVFILNCFFSFVVLLFSVFLYLFTSFIC